VALIIVPVALIIVPYLRSQLREGARE